MRILTFLKKNKIDLFSQKSAVSVFQTHKIENTFFREASSSILKKWIKYDEMEESRRNMKFFRKLFGSLTSLKIWNKKKCLLACLWAHTIERQLLAHWTAHTGTFRSHSIPLFKWISFVTSLETWFVTSAVKAARILSESLERLWAGDPMRIDLVLLPLRLSVASFRRYLAIVFSCTASGIRVPSSNPMESVAFTLAQITLEISGVPIFSARR